MRRRLALLLAVLFVLCAPTSGAQAPTAQQAVSPGTACIALANDILKDPRIAETIPMIAAKPSCFLEASAFQQFQAVRKPILSWLQTYENGKQQGSSVSPTNTTNAVSKPSGPSSLSQENAGQQGGTSANTMTMTISPGRDLTKLELAGILFPCGQPGSPQKGCVKGWEHSVFDPLTIKVTANTNTNAQSLSATATTPGASSPTQPVTFKTLASDFPSFRGLTVQYQLIGAHIEQGVSSGTVEQQRSFFTDLKAAKQGTYSGNQSAGNGSAKQATVDTYYKAELESANSTVDALNNCPIYTNWENPAVANIKADLANKDDANTIALDIAAQYQLLTIQLARSGACPAAQKYYDQLLTNMIAANVYEASSLANANRNANSLSLEYDLNTPPSQMGYSSFKASGSFQFGPKQTKAVEKAAAEFNSKKQMVAQGKLSMNELPSSPLPKGRFGAAVKKLSPQLSRQSADPGAAVNGSTTNPAGNQPCSRDDANPKNKSAQVSSMASSSTPAFSLVANAGADVYNSAPSTDTPNASYLRDLQAGAELNYRFDLPSGGCSFWQTIWTNVGSITLAGAYYYQDQKSPNLLKGPPSSITFTGLPSTATSVYTQRGVINLTQLRLGFGSGSKATFPIAATWSNRTELIAHPTWGLQFGLSYNLNSLFSSSK